MESRYGNLRQVSITDEKKLVYTDDMVILFATKEDYVKGFTITKDVLLYGLNIYRERKLKVQLLSETHPLTHLPSYHCYNSAGKLSAKQSNSNTSGLMISYTNPLTLSAHRISSAS